MRTTILYFDRGWPGSPSVTDKMRVLLAFYLGIPRKNAMPPGDEWDMQRCIRLVDKCPEVQESFADLGKTNPVWGIVTSRWDDLCRTYREQGLHPMGDLFRRILKENNLR